MASKTVQMICVALGAIGLIGVIICCSLPEWLVKHHDYVEVHQGLWKTCEKLGTEPQECRMHDNSRLLNEVQVFRNFTIFSCMLGILSLLLLIFGSDFTSCVQNQDTKPRVILAAGRGLMLAGLLVIIPVSWFSNIFRNAPKTVTLGVSIYIGFIAGLMMMLIGGLICYLSRSRSSSSGGTVSFLGNRV